MKMKKLNEILGLPSNQGCRLNKKDCICLDCIYQDKYGICPKNSCFVCDLCGKPTNCEYKNLKGEVKNDSL